MGVTQKGEEKMEGLREEGRGRGKGKALAGWRREEVGEEEEEGRRRRHGM